VCEGESEGEKERGEDKVGRVFIGDEMELESSQT
jgi:hypothetical protein